MPSVNTSVGFCGYRPQHLKRTRHRGEIGPFFVTRRYQGSGAAAVMMAGVIEEARANGLAQLELFVDTENSRAIAFYERFGFERIATHSDGVRIENDVHGMTISTPFDCSAETALEAVIRGMSSI